MAAPILWNYELDDVCYRARLMAALSGVALDLRSVDMYPGAEHLNPDMLARNPSGQLPVLQHDSLTLTQPEAIMLYLARIGPNGATYLPQELATAARMHDWLFFTASALHCATQARAVAMLDAPGDLPALTKAARTALLIAEDHMTAQGHIGAGFVAGSTPSVADVALFPAFALSRDFYLDHDTFPALRLWARRVRGLQGFITMPGIPDYH